MAEADTDPPNTMDDEDLEDGEIETDEENDVVVNEIKPAPKVAIIEATAAVAAATVTEPAKKPKSSDDELKKATDTKAKGDNRKSTQDNSTKNKKLTTSDVAKGEPPFHIIQFYFVEFVFSFFFFFRFVLFV